MRRFVRKSVAAAIDSSPSARRVIVATHTARRRVAYSRAIFALFTIDQTLESFLRGHVEAFAAFQGVGRTLVYDNLRSAVLERAGTAIRFHPRLLELAGHYHFAPRPCTPGRANEKAYASYCTS